MRRNRIFSSPRCRKRISANT